MIIWQDILIMVGQFGIAIALIPALRAKEKPPWATSLATGSILASFAVAFATLHLLLSTVSSCLVAAMWFALLFQRIRSSRR